MSTPELKTLGHGPKFVLALFALAVLLFTKSGLPASAADASRLGSIQALVEHGTLALDDTNYRFQVDKVRIGGPLSAGGHFYSHQPPMLAIVGAIPYQVLHWLGRGIDSSGTYKIITLSVVGLPLVLGFWCLALLMRHAGVSDRDSTWLLAAASFGTLAFPYALVLNQHGPAAGLVMAALLQAQRRQFVGAGVLLSLATTVDLGAAFFGLATILPIARLGRIKAVIQYGVAALPVLVLHFSINLALVGDLIPLGLHLEAFEYPKSPFLFSNLTGGAQDMLTAPLGPYVVGLLFGGSGLFSHHPILLFALVTGALALFERQTSKDSELAKSGGLAPSIDHAVILGSAGIWLFYSSQSRNYGGWAFGVRWFTVFAPALMLLTASWLGRKPTRRLALAIFIPLLVWSVCAAAIGAIQPWAKVAYRWQETEYGKAALDRGETVSHFDHVTNQLTVLTREREEFSELRWEGTFVELLNTRMRAYSERRQDETREAYRAKLETGLARLDRIAELMEEESVRSAGRLWVHRWRAAFYGQLDRPDEERRERQIARQLLVEIQRSLTFDRERGS